MRTASALLLLACCATATATDIQIVNGDGAGEGFNDPMPVDPLPGNPGSTLGEQRLNVFEAAADFWESLLDSSVTIRVSARFNPLSCAAFSATLGSAGPTTVHRGFTGAPVADTWFTQAEANAISGSDLSGQADINATFNSDIDFNDDCLVGTNWWYGIGEPAPFGTIDLYGTVLHEIAHGLGFLDLVNSDGSKFSGFDDIYMTFLRDGSLGLNWPAMTNAERLASFTDNGDLLWTGTEAVSAASVLSSGVVGGLPRMYAPNPFRSGSSISHWDTVLTPNELMEPFSTATFITGLTLAAFTDMGWPVDQLPLGIHDSYDASEDTTLNVNAGSGVLANDLARGNALSASVVDNPSDGSLSLSADGSFSYDPDPNFDGVDAFTYRPASGTNATTVTVFVAGQNDAPTANDDPGFSVTVNGTLDVAAPGVLDNDDDVDGDALTASRVDDVSHGTLNLDADGSFSYSPAADTCDPVTFTYRANDGTVDSNLATASIAIDDCNASIAVDAMASPTSVDEPGAGATVTVTIENNSLAPGDVTIDTLTDSVDGNLAGSGDCALPQMIAVGNSYQCSYPITVTGNAGDSDTRTVSASGTHADSDPVSDNAMVTVTVDDVLPSGSVALTPSGTVDEGGGNVSVTIEVSNDGSAESLQLTALADDSGSLEGNGDCALPQTIATSGSYSCTATVAIPAQGVGNATVMVTATLADDDGNSINPDQSAMVAVTDAAPTGTVAVTPTPDTVTEAGGTVSFALTFTNTGDESVSLTALDDDGAGNLNGLGSCSVPQTVAGGATYECSYDDAVPTGAPGDETRTITGTFADDDGNTPSAQGMATVTRTDALPTATVTATPDPAILDEPGGATTVTVEVTNTSAADTIDLTSLGDSLAGDLNGLGDCTVPQSIATAASYSCSFTQTISDAAPGPLSTTVTAGFEDDEDNAATANGLASLTIDDLLPTATVGVAVAPDTVSEPGEPVTVTVTVSNTSTADTITVTQLLDSLAGDLNGQGDCATPFDLAPAAIAECSFTAEDDAQAGTLERTVSTLFADEEDNPGTAEGMATVTVTDVAPAISVTLAATPETVAATGGTVSFIATVTNTGTGDALTLTALTDDTLGDLDGSGDCALPQTIPIAGAYSCTYTDTLAGDAGTDGTRTVDATASDEEMTVAPGDGSVTIAFSNEAPLFSLDRSVTSPPVAEPGGTVTFSIVIASEESTRTLTIDSLTDSRDGNLDGTGTCAVPQVLAAGETYRCDYTIEVTGASASVPRTSTTEASATTDDLFSGTAADSASVIFLDVTPMATASYTATPAEATPPSAAVRFDIEIANTGDAEPLELTSLQDDAVGDVSLLGNCQLPATIPPGDSFTCAFTAVVAGEPNEAVARNLTASVADDDGNGVLADDWTMIVFGEAPQMNTAPTAAADSYAATEDTTLVIVAPGLLDNDSDAEDDVLTVFDNTTPAAGTLSVAADGSLTYEPAPDATATVTFSYRATDGAALSESATVTVTIAAVNDPPVAAYDSFSFAGEGSLEVAAPGVLTNDEDVDSAITVRIGTPPASGTVELDADGGFRYTAGAGFAGADTFTYFATDGEFEAEAIVTIAAGGRVFKNGFEEPELPNQP